MPGIKKTLGVLLDYGLGLISGVNRMYKGEEFAFLLGKRRLGRSGYGKIIHLRDISVSLN